MKKVILLISCLVVLPTTQYALDCDVIRTKFFGSVWNQGHADASIVSQDGGFSYIIPDGSLWWYGDTFKGSRGTDGIPHFEGGAVSCAVALLYADAREMPPVLKYLKNNDGRVAQAIPFLQNESWEKHRIWPLGGVYINGKSYIYYSLIELTGEGLWNFRSIGSGLACSKQLLNIHNRIQLENDWRFPVSPSSIVISDEWVYLYDVDKRNGQQGIWLAKVLLSEIENPNEYQFFCGKGTIFTRNKIEQKILLESIYGQVSVVWNEYLKRYILASSSDIFHPREIKIYSSETPFGPWKESFSISVPEYRQGKRVTLVYCSYFHPELFCYNGKVINLTFSLQLEDAGFDVNNEMVEIEVSIIEN